MRHTALKSVFLRLYAFFIMVFVSTLPVSSQYYLNVFQNDGRQYRFVIADIDSINITASIDTLNNPDPFFDDGNHEYVDLGLSVKWATCNIGASQPEEYGDYYAWGETMTKNNYDSESYIYEVRISTKYNENGFGNDGIVDTLTTLEMSDDVARQKWGGNWRMPTKDELTELRENCTWTLTTQNGVNGYMATSNKSGYTDRSIFLPCAGFRYGTCLSLVGSIGEYWSSSLYTPYPFRAWSLHCIDPEYIYMSYDSRSHGKTVRPVCP